MLYCTPLELLDYWTQSYLFDEIKKEKKIDFGMIIVLSGINYAI